MSVKTKKTTPAEQSLPTMPTPTAIKEKKARTSTVAKLNAKIEQLNTELQLLRAQAEQASKVVSWKPFLAAKVAELQGAAEAVGVKVSEVNGTFSVAVLADLTQAIMSGEPEAPHLNLIRISMGGLNAAVNDLEEVIGVFCEDSDE